MYCKSLVIICLVHVENAQGKLLNIQSPIFRKTDGELKIINSVYEWKVANACPLSVSSGYFAYGSCSSPPCDYFKLNFIN